MRVPHDVGARPAARSPLRVTRRDARRALLRHQLARAPLGEIARRLGSVQVDPLAPMGRNHDLVLQARVDGYRIDDWHGPAYRDRTWLDAWDKQACLTLAVDWPARALYHRHHAERWRPLLERHPDAVAGVLARIEHDGPASALGFDDAPRPELRGSWYGPRLVKHLLRALWDTGRLVTRDRERGRHVYDLPERVLPAEVRSAPAFDDARAVRRLVVRRVQAAGLLRRRAPVALWSLPVDAATRAGAIEALVAEGELQAWDVEGDAYLAPPGLSPSGRRTSAAAGPARVLGPLDNLMWDRRALADLFGFDYVWEVYKPAPRRRWGYYVVPVIVGERFVARFDGRRLADGAPRLRVDGWWWEEALPDARALDATVAGLARFLRYLEVAAVELPAGLDRDARAAWRAAAAEASA